MTCIETPHGVLLPGHLLGAPMVCLELGDLLAMGFRARAWRWFDQQRARRADLPVRLDGPRGSGR